MTSLLAHRKISRRWRALPRIGVTSFFPTIASTGQAETVEQIERIVTGAWRQSDEQDAEIAGIRLEGPFISHMKKGAQYALPGGAIGTIEAGRLIAGTISNVTVEIYGSDGSLRWNGMDPNYLYVADGMKANGDQGWRQIPTVQSYPDAIIPGADVPVGGMRFYIAAFADFLTKTLAGRPYDPGLEQGLRVQEVTAMATDVEDVARRVIRILHGTEEQTAHLEEPSVIVATELTPSDTVTLDKQKVLAFCTARGGATSRVAILAKALGIPSIVGLGAAADQLHTSAQVIVNGTTGEIVIQPDEATIAAYRQQARTFAQSPSEAQEKAHTPAITADGKQIEVVANIGSPDEAAGALADGAEGVGLLRTEFLFLDRDTPPDEDEQVAVYSAIMEAMGQRPVVIRTLDIGGDKPAPYLDMPAEMNPFLGVRGLRLSLAHPDMFQVQLRALLRAGAGHNLKIMFPMVASRAEVLAAREQIASAQAALAERGANFTQQYEIGIMVEVPSAALLAEVLAGAVDFFSIGTNDLSQYTLAADRTNAAVAPLADAFHPAVLRLIRMVIEAAHAQGKWVGLCGELAGDPLVVPVLLGLGLDEFSMTACSVPLVKQAIRRCTLAQARETARYALALGNASEVRAYLRSL